MRYKGLDLNLLTALEALLTERNVSRAADRLNMSQSAASSALSRLREQLNDELLIPVGRSLKLSKRSEALLPRVRSILANIESEVMSVASPDPTKESRLIRIMASDYVASAVLAEGLARISENAPGLDFEIVPVTDYPASAIESYEIDLLITLDLYISKDHPSVKYFEDDYVAVCCASVAKYFSGLTVEAYGDAPQVAVKLRPSGNFTYDHYFLERQGFRKKVVSTVSSHALIPYFIISTDRIATLQRRQADSFCRHFNLRILELPILIPPIREAFQWHQSNNGDKVIQYVVERLVDIAADGSYG